MSDQTDLSELTRNMTKDEVDLFYSAMADNAVNAAASIREGRQKRHEQALAAQYQAELAGIKQGDVRAIMELKRSFERSVWGCTNGY